MSPPRLILLLALLLFPATARADEEAKGPYQFGNVIYTLPPDWGRGRTDDDRTILYNNGYHFLSVLHGEAMPDDLAAWLEERMRGDLDEGEDVVQLLKPAAAAVGRSTVQIGSGRYLRDGRGELRFYVALPAGDRAELIRFDGPGGDAQEVAATTAAFNQIVEPFLTGLRFVSKGAKPVIGDPVPGPLAGVYCGMTFATDGMARVQANTRFLTFDQSGRFVSGTPDGVSLVRPDFDEVLAEFPDAAGNYELVGDKLTLRFADGDRDEYDYGVADGREDGKPGITLGGDWLGPVPPPADGLKLDGVYGSYVARSTGAPGTANFTAVSGETRFAFKPDGTFSTTGSTSYVGGSNVGDARADWSGSGEDATRTGTYAVKDGLLTLKFKGGPARAVSLLPVEDGLIYLDGEQYLRQ